MILESTDSLVECKIREAAHHRSSIINAIHICFTKPALVSLRMVSEAKIIASIMAELPSSKPSRTQSSLGSTPELKITDDAEVLSACSSFHQPEASTQLERHSDLWFDDGSVICQAENTLFKVHMSQLARHSVCFRDMFSLPQPVSRRCSSTDLASVGNSQQSHRIPFIQLHDSAEDVGNLLTALYDGPCVDDLFVVGGINSSSAHKAISETMATKTFEAYLESFAYRPST